MWKSSISLLQEITIKSGYVPTYNEVPTSQTGTTKHLFRYQVTCKQYSAYGDAIQKKEAKTNAATAMLKVLLAANEVPHNFVESVQTKISACADSASAPPEKASVATKTIANVDEIPSCPSSVETFSPDINYVGKLQELCVVKSMGTPLYTCISQSGPSHDPVFTICCSVLCVSEEGTASTKKIAKHLAAKRVLLRLMKDSDIPMQTIQTKQINKDDDVEYLLKTLDVKMGNMKLDLSKEFEIEKNKAIEAFHKVKLPDKKVRVLPKLGSCQISDYHSALQTTCFNAAQLLKDNLPGMLSVKDHNEQFAMCKTILSKAFNVEVEIISLPPKTGNNEQVVIIAVRLSTNPVMVQIGIGQTKEAAEHAALTKTLSLILSFINGFSVDSLLGPRHIMC